jgi:DNA-binding XRE family transcriptional regulator
MQRKTETFIYQGLGFPIELINAPMKKIFGKWVIDIDLNALQLFVFKELIRKPSPLTGKELKFMRKFLEMSRAEVGKILGIHPATICTWEAQHEKQALMSIFPK